MADVGDKYPQFSPFQFVGEFKLGEEVNFYADKLKNFIRKPNDEFGNEYFESEDGNILLCINKNIITSVFCYSKLFYKDTNLIGLHIDSFGKLLNSTYVGEVDSFDLGDEQPTYVYEFDSIGAQVWVLESKIVTIIAGCEDNYSDEPYYD